MVVIKKEIRLSWESKRGYYVEEDTEKELLRITNGQDYDCWATVDLDIDDQMALLAILAARFGVKSL